MAFGLLALAVGLAALLAMIVVLVVLALVDPTHGGGE
jgi:hypothetical protein